MNRLALIKVGPELFINKQTQPIEAIVFDHKGNFHMIQESIKKSEFCQKHSLLKRDLKFIQGNFKNLAPTVNVRQQAILINLLSVRAMIKYDSLFIFTNPNSNSHHLESLLMHQLQGYLQYKEEPYEMRALEAILDSVFEYIKTLRDDLLPTVQEELQHLQDHPKPETLKSLLVLKNKINNLQVNIDAVITCITKLLNNDDDMANMYLSAKHQQRPRKSSEHLEVEYMLEHYLSMFEEINTQINTKLITIRSTESLVQLTLDTQRNRLLIFELRATVAALGIATGTFATSIYGMNIHNGWEEVPGVLPFVAGSCGLAGMIVFGIVSQKLNRLTKQMKLLNNIPFLRK